MCFVIVKFEGFFLKNKKIEERRILLFAKWGGG